MLPGLMNDQKRIAALILGNVDDNKEKKVEESVDQVGLSVAAEDIMSAFKNSSAQELRVALKTFIDLCYQGKEQEEEMGEKLESYTESEEE